MLWQSPTIARAIAAERALPLIFRYINSRMDEFTGRDGLGRFCDLRRSLPSELGGCAFSLVLPIPTAAVVLVNLELRVSIEKRVFIICRSIFDRLPIKIDRDLRF